MHFVYRLMREEGLLLGSTAGINVAAAVTLAKQIGPGHTIVTVLCEAVRSISRASSTKNG